jgi:hypothetical protein
VETTRAKKPQEQFLNELTHSAKVELTIRNPTFIARSRVGMSAGRQLENPRVRVWDKRKVYFVRLDPEPDAWIVL